MAVSAVRDLPPCACGCGEPVRRRAARFLPGHHLLSPTWRRHQSAASAAWWNAHPEASSERGDQIRRSRGGEERECIRCHGRVWVRTSESAKWDGLCSQACRSIRCLQPRNPLQVRIIEKLSRSFTLADFARSMGVAPDVLSRWFRGNRRRGSRLATNVVLAGETIAKLASGLAIPFQQAVTEAGGVTAADKRRRFVATVLAPERSEDGHSRVPEDERQRRGKASGTARKGRPHPISEQAIQMGKEAGRWNKWQESQARFNKSIEGRTVHSLYGRLDRHPGRPSSTGIAMWADDASRRLQVSQLNVEVSRFITKAWVLSVWKPYLQDLGLASRAGRKPLQARFALIKQLRANGRKWKEIALEVGRNEALPDGLEPTAEYLRMWFVRYRHARGEQG
jgi:hypothetical protein